MKLVPVLWKYYKSKSGTYPVKIRITHDNKKEYIKMNFSVKQEQWTGARVKNHQFATEYNGKIVETLLKLEKNFLADGSVSTGDKESFNWWFEDYLALCKEKHGLYHYKKMNNVFTKIKEFRKHILVKQIDSKLVSDFELFLLKQNHHVNYIADVIKRFKFIVGLIVKAGAMEYHKNPFLSYKLKFVPTQRERLSFEDVMKLAKVKLNDKDQELARDIYIVSFYAGGIRFGDCCRLKKENFQDGRLRYTMRKTATQKNIKLPVKAFKIMDKYDYCFPIRVNWDQEDESISSRRTTLCKKLKAACRAAGIKEVTFHTSRHSIADYAIKSKLSDQQLQDILGHKRSATTQIYKKSFYLEENDEAMDKLFG